MSGLVTLTDAQHAAAAATYEASCDWSNASAEWQAAIDTANPGDADYAINVATYRARQAAATAASHVWTAQGT